MALSDAEIWRCKQELGFNLLTVGAEPYIGVTAIFNQVIQVYLGTSAATTSTTAVVAAEAPTVVSLTLASVTGFSAGIRAVIDVDDAQETATVRSVTGSVISVFLSKAHAAGYPVSVEGPETIVRELLNNIRKVKAEMADTFGIGSLKQVDEIQFYQTGGGALFGNLGAQLCAWREELAAAFGIRSMWAEKRAGGSRMSVY
jgi:hypothetical protein